MVYARHIKQHKGQQMIIGVLNQKGGVGKTTLSTNIAHQLSAFHPDENVMLVDADPQQSALSWVEARSDSPPFNVIGLASKTLHRDLPKLVSQYRFVVIDGPPRTTDLARSCIMASDLVIIPCTPSPYDVWASEETIRLLEEAKVYKEKLKSAFVINRKITNTAIGRDVLEALEAFDIPTLAAQISQRVVFAEAAASGQTVLELEAHGKAAKEIAGLVNEITEKYSKEVTS